MDLISVLLVVAVVGFFVWLLITYVPMPPPIQTVIVVVTAIVLVLYVLRALGFVLPNVLRS